MSLLKTQHLAQSPFSETSEMSARAAERVVEIKILNVLGVVKSTWYRLTGKAKPQPYQVTITVEPHPEWEKEYSHKDFPMEVMLGRNPPKHVWMPRKGAGSSWVDKP